MNLVFKELKGHEIGIWEAQVLALAHSPSTCVTWSHPFNASGPHRLSWVNELTGWSSLPPVDCSAALLRETLGLHSRRKSLDSRSRVCEGHDFIQDVYLPDPTSKLVASSSPGKLAAFCNTRCQWVWVDRISGKEQSSILSWAGKSYPQSWCCVCSD